MDAAQSITGMNAANKDVFLTKVRPFIMPLFELYLAIVEVAKST